MELIDVKISSKEDLISGVKILDGSQWIYLNLNPVDFVLDGFIFVNKDYIDSINFIEEDEIEYKVIKSKINRLGEGFNTNYDTNSINGLMLNFQSSRKLVELEFEKPENFTVGTIEKVLEHTFIVNILSTEGEFLGKDELELTEIRSISYNTDYLLSFENYLNL